MIGHREFLRQRLEAGGDLGQFLHPVLALLGGAGEELEIVDHEDIEALLALQAPGACDELRDGDAAGLVDVERHPLHLRAASATRRGNSAS